MTKNIYFAHPMSDYGQLWEARAMLAIDTYFPNSRIINPNHPRHAKGFNTMRLK